MSIVHIMASGNFIITIHIYLNWNFFAFLPRNWLTFLPWYLRTTLFRDRFVLGRTGLSWNLLARFFGNLPRNLFTHLKVGMYVRSDTMKPKWFWIQIWWYQTFLIKSDLLKKIQKYMQNIKWWNILKLFYSFTCILPY